MKARILGPHEWPKLEGHDLSTVLNFCEPWNVAVAVVEDESGKIVACLAAVRVTHLEGTWIDPEYRGNAGVLRALLRQASNDPKARGEKWAFCGTDGVSEKIEDYIGRLGGVQLPGRFYVLPIGGES